MTVRDVTYRLRSSLVHGDDIVYRVHLPAEYTAGPEVRRYPLLMLLHGRGGSMNDWHDALRRIDRGVAGGELDPLVVVMPDAPWSDRAGFYVDAAGPGGPAIETALLGELVPELDRRLRLLPGRRHRMIGGISMGGYGAVRWALTRPDLFGQALALSPAVYRREPPLGSSARQLGAFAASSPSAAAAAAAAAAGAPARAAAEAPAAAAASRTAAVVDGEQRRTGHPDPFDQRRFDELNYPGALVAFLRLTAGLTRNVAPPSADADPQYAPEAAPGILQLFIGVGDDEPAGVDARGEELSLTVEAERLFEAVQAVPGIHSSLRVYPGGHDSGTWGPALDDGLRWLRAVRPPTPDGAAPIPPGMPPS